MCRIEGGIGRATASGLAVRFLVWALVWLLVPAAETRAQAGVAVSPLDDFEREMLSLARRTEPIVVNIVAKLAPAPESPGTPEDGQRAEAPAQKRIGSGIAINGHGGIITTASIVDGAISITVRTREGGVFPAGIVGLDRRTNVALLQAVGARTTAARLAESSLVTPGSRVVVVGSVPYRQPMCSFGTIEMDRGLVWGYSEVEMLQMNAPLIRGSAGAAVVNSEGRVVGMVSGTLADTGTQPLASSGGGLAGFIYGSRVISAPGTSKSFAIPIEKALEISAELKQRGRVERGFLGVIFQRAPGAGKSPPGVLVSDVLRGGPADRAGITIGDVILKYAGGDVTVGDDLTFLVSATRPGSHVATTVRRGGRLISFDVVVGLAPNVYPSSSQLPSELSLPSPPVAGASGGQSPSSEGADSVQRKRP